MAKSTFSGPVKSLSGFISAGNANVVSLTADTTLTVDAHAGKVLTCNDADGKFTLPSIVATAPGSDDDPNQISFTTPTVKEASNVVSNVIDNITSTSAYDDPLVAAERDQAAKKAQEEARAAAARARRRERDRNRNKPSKPVKSTQKSLNKKDLAKVKVVKSTGRRGGGGGKAKGGLMERDK